jgi:hypothetical protein
MIQIKHSTGMIRIGLETTHPLPGASGSTLLSFKATNTGLAVCCDGSAPLGHEYDERDYLTVQVMNIFSSFRCVSLEKVTTIIYC